MIGKSTTVKILKFDGTGPLAQHHKQFKAAAAHNQWSGIEKAIIITVCRKRAALLQIDTIEYATLMNCLQQRFAQKHTAPVKREKLKNCKQKSRKGLQDYTTDIQRFAQEAYPSMDPESVESAAVEIFVDSMHDWEMQSLDRIHSCKSITAVEV